MGEDKEKIQMESGTVEVLHQCLKEEKEKRLMALDVMFLAGDTS